MRCSHGGQSVFLWEHIQNPKGSGERSRGQRGKANPIMRWSLLFQLLQIKIPLKLFWALLHHTKLMASREPEKLSSKEPTRFAQPSLPILFIYEIWMSLMTAAGFSSAGDTKDLCDVWGAVSPLWVPVQGGGGQRPITGAQPPHILTSPEHQTMVPFDTVAARLDSHRQRPWAGENIEWHSKAGMVWVVSWHGHTIQPGQNSSQPEPCSEPQIKL